MNCPLYFYPAYFDECSNNEVLHTYNLNMKFANYEQVQYLLKFLQGITPFEKLLRRRQLTTQIKGFILRAKAIISVIKCIVQFCLLTTKINVHS